MLTTFSNDGLSVLVVNALALITGLTLSGNLPPCTSTIAGFLLSDSNASAGAGNFILSSRNNGGYPLIRA